MLNRRAHQSPCRSLVRVHRKMGPFWFRIRSYVSSVSHASAPQRKACSDARAYLMSSSPIITHHPLSGLWWTFQHRRFRLQKIWHDIVCTKTLQTMKPSSWIFWGGKKKESSLKKSPTIHLPQPRPLKWSNVEIYLIIFSYSSSTVCTFSEKKKVFFSNIFSIKLSTQISIFFLSAIGAEIEDAKISKIFEKK